MAKAKRSKNFYLDSHFILDSWLKATTIEVMAVVLCVVFTRNKRNKT